MHDALVNALAGETVVHSNTLATVTRNCVIVRNGLHGSQVVVGIETITDMRKVITTNPGLLVVSAGLFTIAAASYVSRQDMETTALIAIVGGLFVLAYFGGRRAAVLFFSGSEQIESVPGGLREASALIRAVNRTRGTQPDESILPVGNQM